ncbi:HNH endonuclease [Synechocystis salina LEGE 06099]|uniref:HNH endonuclease n=1 Tax=Synechocystis salina TaxID=945780 RepID=UPI0018808E82|nr:HNH endonuclease [Synechocystis salina]MBE9202562.1 HNH endonuclease [Synechocystis salina LEGE 06099]
MNFLDDSGNPLKFTISLESWNIEGNPAILVESRSGKKGSGNERNGDYNKGLEILFKRLGDNNIAIINIIVQKTRQVLPESEKRLQLNYPVNFHGKSLDQISKIRRHIGSLQASVARIPGSKGKGNSTKCIKIWLQPKSKFIPEPNIIFGYQNKLKNLLDLTQLKDERIKIETTIVARQGQEKFRRQLLDIYGSKCLITKCDVEKAIDAAHIIPYLGIQGNQIENGLLLRSDIHNLFDLGLIAIDPDTLCVKISSKIESNYYEKLNNRRLERTVDGHDLVACKYLRWHLNNIWLS